MMVALAAPFLHKLHMTMVKDCAACHVSAPKSTRAEDNNLPRAGACKDCHDKVAIKEPRKTLVIKFSHDFHMKMAGKPAAHSATRGWINLKPSRKRPSRR